MFSNLEKSWTQICNWAYSAQLVRHIQLAVYNDVFYQYLYQVFHIRWMKHKILISQNWAIKSYTDIQTKSRSAKFISGDLKFRNIILVNSNPI